jgi:hypothetical protein
MQSGQLKRREFISLLGGAAAAWPFAVRAQQPAIPVVGFLNGASPEKYEPFVNSFLQGLKETGYTERQNVIIEYRWADGQYARFPGNGSRSCTSAGCGHCGEYPGGPHRQTGRD